MADDWVYFIVKPWWRSLRRDRAYRRHPLLHRLVRKRIGADWRTDTEIVSQCWTYRRAIGTLRTIRLRIMADRRSPTHTTEERPA